MVMKGARYEEIEGAEALYHQAENAYNEALAYHVELNLVAPAAGEISKRISDNGEVIASGYPIFTIINPNDSRVVLQLKEDQMAQIKNHKSYYGKVPALGSGTYEFTVTYISSMADFATWKATNQKGDFDLKTFEIHLKPKNHIDGLRPGMTVQIDL
jgi:HlyD family secretion protein